MSVLSSIFNFVSAQRQNHFNEQQAAASRRYSEQMWDKNNAYNSPSNQKALLQQAGLNPNMLYAQGGVDASSQLQTASPQASSAGLPLADFNPLSTVGDLQSLNLQSIEIEKQKLIKEQEQENLNILKQTLSGMKADNARKVMENFDVWLKRYFTQSAFSAYLDSSDVAELDPETGTPVSQGHLFRFTMDSQKDESLIKENLLNILSSIFMSWQSEGVDVRVANNRIDEIKKSIDYMTKQMESMDADAEASQALSSVMKRLPDNIAGDFLRILVYMFGSGKVSIGIK